jgi:hypothetical protein
MVGGLGPVVAYFEMRLADRPSKVDVLNAHHVCREL